MNKKDLDNVLKPLREMKEEIDRLQKEYHIKLEETKTELNNYFAKRNLDIDASEVRNLISKALSGL